ncbi:MAG TPA: hypothetical protein VGD69_10125 [Herpetosiphonaceae bacterium]
MNQPSRPVFRAEAVRRYMDRQEQAVLPRLIAPRTWLWLWLLAALLVGSAGSAWMAKVPVYMPGRAVVLEPASSDHMVTALLVLPPDALAQLQRGQPIMVFSDRSRQPITGALIAVEPRIMSPVEIQHRFVLHMRGAQVADQPSAVALARLDLPPDLPAVAYIGSHYQANAAVGSRRVLTFLPIFDQFLGG